MNFVLSYIKKYPISCVLFAMIWYLSFFSPPKTELDEVEFIDKWVHVGMYGFTCIVLWLEYTRKHLIPDYEKLLFWAFGAPIIMSGIIELLQEYCTGGRRSGEWLDLAANSTGVTLAAIIGLIVIRRCRSTHKKDA